MAVNTVFTNLRGWLDRLRETDRLAEAKPGIPLEFTLAAVAKRLDGRKAVLFPRPGGHEIPVVAGIVADRAWIAEAMGVEPDEVLQRYEAAISEPLPVEAIPERSPSMTPSKSPNDFSNRSSSSSVSAIPPDPPAPCDPVPPEPVP